MTDYSLVFIQVKKKNPPLLLNFSTKDEHFGAGLRMLALGMLTAAKLQNLVQGVFCPVSPIYDEYMHSARHTIHSRVI